MSNELFPRSADNTYGGYKTALWLFALVVLMKTGMSLNAIFNGHFVASYADGLPLDAFTPAGADAVVSLFAGWGVSHLALCSICFLVLLRYRALVPLMFGVMLLEHAGRRMVSYFLPIARTGPTPGPVVNLVLLALMIVGLSISLRRPQSRQVQGV